MTKNPGNATKYTLKRPWAVHWTEEETEYYQFTTIYPFSIGRTMAMVSISLALFGAVLGVLVAFVRFYRQPMEARLQKLESVLGSGLASEGFLIVIGIGIIIAMVLVLVTVAMVILPRIKRTLAISACEEAIEAADSLPLFPFGKKYILMEDVEGAAIVKDAEGRWLEVAVAACAPVRLPLRTRMEDREEEEGARELAEMIMEHLKRREKKDRAAGGAAWKQRLAGIVNDDEFDEMDNEEKSALIRGLLEEVAAGFEDTKIVQKDDDRRIELRMRRKDVPVRVAISYYGQRYPEIEVQPGPKGVSFYLSFDESKIPRERDAADPWSEDDELTVFVAKGVYATEDHLVTVEETLAALGALPGKVLADMLAGMEGRRYNLCHFLARDDKFLAEMTGIYELDDPVREISEAVNFVADIAAGMGVEPLHIPGESPRRFEFIRCDYCGSRYPFGLREQCPNCGSPPK